MTLRTLGLCGLVLFLAISPADAVEYLTGLKWQEPPVVTPGAANSDPPADAMVLFDGKNFDEWQGADNWKIEDGAAVVGKGMITTKREFGDIQLHLEWAAPKEAKGQGQGRGNSGVHLMGRYEIQVLDSFNNKTYADGQAGAIYKQSPPMANAMRPPGEWNTYDIFWTCPRYAEDGTLESPAYITAMHNGVLIHNHFPLLGDTPFNRPPRYDNFGPKGPISLQDHTNPVRYRNIWVREIKPAVPQRVREPYMFDGNKELPIPKNQKPISVTGKVTIDGQPLSKGTISFSPPVGGRTFSTTTNDRGEYTIEPTAGMSTSLYNVTIQGKEGATTTLPARVQKPTTTDLTIRTREGTNEFDFELESK
jgi:hypothetical protein